MTFTHIIPGRDIPAVPPAFKKKRLFFLFTLSLLNAQSRDDLPAAAGGVSSVALSHPAPECSLLSRSLLTRLSAGDRVFLSDSSKQSLHLCLLKKWARIP